MADQLFGVMSFQLEARVLYFLNTRRTNEALLRKLTVTLSVRTDKCIDLGPLKYFLSLSSVTLYVEVPTDRRTNFALRPW